MRVIAAATGDRSQPLIASTQQAYSGALAPSVKENNDFRNKTLHFAVTRSNVTVIVVPSLWQSRNVRDKMEHLINVIPRFIRMLVFKKIQGKPLGLEMEV
jgi:hypothetical protein